MKIILVGDDANEKEKIISALHAIGENDVHVYQEEKQILADACLVCDTAIRRGGLVQQVIVNIANSVGTSKNLNDLYRIINYELNRLIDATNLYIAIYDPKKDLFQLPLQHDKLEESIPVIPAGKTLTRYIYTTNQALLLKFDDIEKMAKEGLIERRGVPAQVWMGVPLRSESSTIGVLVVQNYENKDAYTLEYLELLKFLSNQIRISIDLKKSELELIEAKEKAVQSDRLKTSFLTNMSHEVRTPMNAIIGFSTLLNDEDISKDETMEYVSLIASNASALLRIIDNVIEVAKLEAGEVELERKQFGINQLLVDLLDTFERSEDRRPEVSVSISAAGSDEEYMLYNDSSRLTQMLSILIGNALKFTEEGSVDFGYKLNDNNSIEFIIKDTGIGIPTSQQVNIFERFRQADNSLTRKFGGTGLGLTIVKHLVELMEGEIFLESEEGKGTQFRIILPVVQQKVEILPGIAVKPKPKLDLSGKHILVVEDVESNYQYIVAVLKSTMVSIHWITDGNAAVDFCLSYPDIDMVFMDINLPGIDGYAATRIIRESKPDLPIIALTAYAMTGERERSQDAGCNDYLSKPVSPKELLAIVTKFLT